MTAEDENESDHMEETFIHEKKKKTRKRECFFYEWKYDVSHYRAAYKLYILKSHYCDTLKWEIMKIARQEWEQLNIEHRMEQ